MNILDLLKGKNMMVETDLKTMAEMTIDHVEEKRNSRELEAATPQNDWWPEEESWVTLVVHFTNGSKKEFSSLRSINIHQS